MTALRSLLSGGRLYAIAANTAREALRSRALLGLLIAALAFIAFSLVLANLAVRGEGGRVVTDFGLFAISLFVVVIAITTGTILVFKEIDRKTIFTLIPKPVHRREIVLGKYAGMMVNLGAVTIALSLAWFGVLALQGVELRGDHVAAILLVYAEAGIIASVALLFSSFSSPILSGVFTFGLFLLGRTAFIVGEMLDSPRGLFVDHPALRPIGDAYVAICPDLQVFNTTQEILLGIPITTHYVLASFGYAAAYSVFFLLVGIVLFERRDFT